MKTNFDIEQFIESGVIENELDYERAMIADRKLRLLSKGNLHFKNIRNKLRSLIEVYESKSWSDVQKVSKAQLLESKVVEKMAEAERIFIENRKKVIRKKMKSLDLNQEDLAHILGHKSKTHMSELMNGIRPFTLPDLVAISHLLSIDVNELVPKFLPYDRVVKIQTAISELNKRNLFKRIAIAASM